ncbi:MAG: type II secretion system protein GspJ [Planctomycetota bacterium]
MMKRRHRRAEIAQGRLCPAAGAQNVCGQRTGRQAFTLVEVMLALTLSVILLGAIFTAMDQSWRLTANGREEMERSQLARALIRKIAIDVRSISFVPPIMTDDSASAAGASTSTGSTGSTGASTSAGSSGSSSTGSTGTTATGTSTTDTTATDTPTARSIGIRGNAQRVEMHISRARRDLNFSSSVNGNNVQSRSSDLRVLTYQLSTSGSGLIRTDGDRLATLMVEDKGGAATTLAAQQVLAPEVSYLQFRYFDGAAWYTSWDSESSGRLPRSIEVTIGFAPPKNKPGPLFRVTVSQSANQFRTVILIPIADPLPEEFVP